MEIVEAIHTTHKKPVVKPVLKPLPTSFGSLYNEQREPNFHPQFQAVIFFLKYSTMRWISHFSFSPSAPTKAINDISQLCCPPDIPGKPQSSINNEKTNPSPYYIKGSTCESE